MERHFDEAGNETAVGIRVTCPNPLHGRHSKYRSARLGIATYGARAAEFYLGAWLTDAYAAPSKAEHRNPSKADVQAYAETVLMVEE